MEIIIYSHNGDKQKRELINEISQTLQQRIEVVSGYEELFHVIKQRISGELILIFLFSSLEEIECLSLTKEGLVNTRFIFVLPNWSDELVSKALSLYPRFMTHIDHSLNDLSAVLDKMIQNDSLNEKRLNVFKNNRTRDQHIHFKKGEE